MIEEQDPLEQLKKLKAAKAQGGDDPLEALKRRKATAAATADEAQPGIGTKALGVAASLVRDIPGAEAAQAIGRSGTAGGGPTAPGAAGVAQVIANAIGRGRRGYQEALSDIRGAEDAAPKPLTIAARVAGAIPAALALPGGMVAQGATYGALSGALDSDPDAGLEQRGGNAVSRAAGGAALGAGAGVLRLVRNAPKGALGEAASEFLPGNVKRGVKAVKALREPPTVRPKIRLMEASAPKAEGFIGNDVANIAEAVKARATRPSIDDLYNAEAAAVDAVQPRGLLAQTAKEWKPRSAPKARFEWFAERMANRRP